MIEPDTIRLLRECDAGVSMGVESIDEVLPYVQNTELKDALSQCKDKHTTMKCQKDDFHSGVRPASVKTSYISVSSSIAASR